MFLGFWVSGPILKYLLQFLNDYGDLGTIKPGDQVKESLGAVGEAFGAGGSGK